MFLKRERPEMDDFERRKKTFVVKENTFISEHSREDSQKVFFYDSNT